jgi:hypothetical protein
VAFGLTALAGVAMVVREGPSPKRLAAAFIQPLAACAVMAAAIWLVARGMRMAGIEHPAIYLLVEIAVGGLAYVAAALVLCRETAVDLLGLLKKALKK